MSLATIVRGLGGGALIGLAAAIVLLVHGRIAGVSGILGQALDRGPALDRGSAHQFRLGFLTGLVVAGAVAAAVVPLAFGGAVRGLPAVAVAGLLVGVGTTLGNGCTSGHGVCGLSRGSPRSIVAVLTFMTTAAITVALLGARS
ncbi:MAG: YeeE/YedE family protein [Kofleriaceae bacterium]